MKKVDKTRLSLKKKGNNNNNKIISIPETLINFVNEN